MWQVIATSGVTGGLNPRNLNSGLWCGVLLVSAFLSLLIAYYWPFLNGSHCFYHRDCSAFFEPFCTYMQGAFNQGRLPLWNSSLYCGMSQAAVTSPGIFYPPNVLFAVFPYSVGLALIQILHQVVAAVGVFALVRQVQWGTPAALIAAIIVGLCGYQFATIDNYTLTASFAWLPACMASLVYLGSATKMQSAGTKIAIVSLAVCCALTVLGGRPEIALPGLLILFLSAVWQLGLKLRLSNSENRVDGAKTFAVQLSALALGLLLSMPGVLPAAEWTALSPRASGLESTSVLAWSANWYDLLGLIVAQPFGDTTSTTCPFLPLINERSGFVNYIGSAFVGSIAATLAIWGLFDKTWRWKHRLPVVLLLVVSLLVSLGANASGLGLVVSKFQFLRLLRYPIKLIIFADTAIAVLAARGMMAAAINPGDSKPIKIAAILWALFGAFTVSLHQSTATLAVLSGSQNEGLLHSAATTLVTPCVWAVLLGFGTCFARACLAGGKMQLQTFAAVVMAGLALTLSYAAFAHPIQGADSDFYARKPAMQTIMEHENLLDPAVPNPRLFFVDINSWSPAKGYLDAHGGMDLGFWSFQRDILKPNSNLDWHLAETFGYEASATRTFQNLVFDAVNEDVRGRKAAALRAGSGASGSLTEKMLVDDPQVDLPLYKLCRLTATGIVATRAADFDDSGRKLGNYLTLSKIYFEPITDINAMLNLKCYKVRNPLGRAYFPRAWIWKESPEEIERICLGADGRNVDPLELSLIYSPTAVSHPQQVAASDEQVPTVQFLKSANDEHVMLRSTTKTPRLLVLADTYYPGWKALIDHDRVDVLRVNVFSRGVVVPSGSHLVEFIYDPMSIKVALALSAFASFICVLLMAGSIWQLANSGKPGQHEDMVGNPR